MLQETMNKYDSPFSKLEANRYNELLERIRT